jgi:hypothetical protein
VLGVREGALAEKQRALEQKEHDNRMLTEDLDRRNRELEHEKSVVLNKEKQASCLLLPACVPAVAVPPRRVRG